jgi:hypothetical protein
MTAITQSQSWSLMKKKLEKDRASHIETLIDPRTTEIETATLRGRILQIDELLDAFPRLGENESATE